MSSTAVPAGDRAKTVSPWAVDVKPMKWTQMKPGGPAPTGRMTGLWAPLWYDRAHNVHLFLNAVSRGARYEGGVTETWAYRYKRAEKKGD